MEPIEAEQTPPARKLNPGTKCYDCSAPLDTRSRWRCSACLGKQTREARKKTGAMPLAAWRKKQRERREKRQRELERKRRARQNGGRR